MTPFDDLAPLWLKKLMADFDLTAVQAAGILGNLGYESDGFTKLHEEGQPEGMGGYGAAQWTGARRRAFLAYAENQKLDWQSDEANYGFLAYELRGAYRVLITNLIRCETVDQAVWEVGQTYERPGGTTAANLPGYEDRLAWARRVLAGAASTTPEPAPLPPSSPVDRGVIIATIKLLQSQLKVFPSPDQPYYTGEVDGDPGPQTQAALTAWRQS